MANTKKIEELEAEIARLKEEDAAFDALTPDQKTAKTLHQILCHSNHIDGCGWGYEVVKGPEGAILDDCGACTHGAYMQKALMLRGFCRERGLTTETALDLLTFIKEIQ